MPALRLLAASACLAALIGCAGPRAVARAQATGHPEVELVSVVHRVEPGQTLYRIALAYGLTPQELMSANRIADPRTLAPGQRLVIPGADRARRVEPAPWAASPPKAEVASTGVARPPAPSPPPQDRAPSPRARPGAGVPPRPQSQLKVGSGTGALEWPLRGVLYGRFGRRGKEPHDGIDLAAPKGTPVRTAAPGRVVFAGEQRGYGNLVIIDHGGELVTLYAHNHDLRVKEGQQVRARQVIATVGESGRTSGPHLHFEVRKRGLPVDPLAHLGPVPSS